MLSPLAHSPKQEGEAGDPYVRHIESVKSGAEARAVSMFRYFKDHERIPALVEAIKCAATFHDLGKVDPDNKRFTGWQRRLSSDHIDAATHQPAIIDGGLLSGHIMPRALRK